MTTGRRDTQRHMKQSDGLDGYSGKQARLSTLDQATKKFGIDAPNSLNLSICKRKDAIVSEASLHDNTIELNSAY